MTPTVLGLLGVPVAASGRDGSAAIGHGGRADRERDFAMSMFGDADVFSVWTPTTACQRDFGSLRQPIPDGCFDRATDPDGFRARSDPVLEGELDAWRAARLAEGAAFSVVTAAPWADTLRQLEELGYVE